jgi:SAM-dependent methyltransferase
MTSAELRDEVVRLGPWHIDIEVTPEVSTAAFLDAPPDTYSEEASQISFHNPRDGFLRRLMRTFPNGLEGRSVLDCACNCGAYLFYAKEAGAGRCLGFDIREHWIDQARFLAEHRERPSDEVHFEVLDLYDLPKLRPGRFDVTFFMGILYHLPELVTGLKLAADITDEVMIVNTATRAGHPDGLLVSKHESPTKLMSGNYGLAWLPTGPVVLTRILHWLGFPEVRCSVWRHAPRQRKDLDRLEVIAARTPGFFSDWDAAVPEESRMEDLLGTRTAPDSTIYVLGNGFIERDIAGRTLVCMTSYEELSAAVDKRPVSGVSYAAIVGDALAEKPADAVRLEERGIVILDHPDLRLYELRSDTGRAVRVQQKTDTGARP